MITSPSELRNEGTDDAGTRKDISAMGDLPGTVASPFPGPQMRCDVSMVHDDGGSTVISRS